MMTYDLSKLIKNAAFRYRIFTASSHGALEDLTALPQCPHSKRHAALSL